MDTFPKDFLNALYNTGNDKPSSTADLVDKNQDGLNTTPSHAPHCLARASSHQNSHHGSSQQNIQLPAEILLHIFNLLSIPQLLPCQQVSRSFRIATRTVLMDRLGGGPSHLRQCSVCQPPYLPYQQLQQRAMSTSGIHLGSVSTLTERELARIGGGLSLSNTTCSSSLGLPPLPQNHQSNLSHSQQQPVQQQHQLHHHLYQRQDPSDAIHHQTDLHLHHPPLHNNTHVYLQRQQFHHDAGYVAPGTLALFLLPHHDHTPTGWQDRQAVHLHCTGVDRAREQLIFQPMVVSDREGTALRFNTNSWNLPTFGTLSPTPLAVSMASTLSSSGGSSATSTSLRSIGSQSHSRSSSRGSTNSVGSSSSTASGSGRESPAAGTRIDLFDYTTGQFRRQQQQPSSSTTTSTGSLFSNSEQSNQDERNLLGHQVSSVLHSRSPCLTSSPSSHLSLSSSSSSSSSSISINGNPDLTAPSWAAVNGAGGEHYSVIGVKHGDWPEDRQAAGRWWGGGLHSSMTHESMMFLPWARAPGGDGSAIDHQQQMLRQEMEMEHVAPATRTLGRQDDKSTHGQGCQDEGPKGGEDEEDVCSKVHVHKMYLSSTRAHQPPGHHLRFLCLHHDQLMADIASSDPFSVSGKVACSTAGSKHLALEYGVRVLESKRCLFCLSSPCKANLEIQVKFDQVRVSLDWILSGFVPEVNL